MVTSIHHYTIHTQHSIPQTTGRGSLEGGAVVEQVSIEVYTDVGLEAVREALEDHVHVNAVSVGPGMLEILLQSLFKGVGDLVKLVELPDPLHGGVVPAQEF